MKRKNYIKELNKIVRRKSSPIIIIFFFVQNLCLGQEQLSKIDSLFVNLQIKECINLCNSELSKGSFEKIDSIYFKKSLANFLGKNYSQSMISIDSAIHLSDLHGNNSLSISSRIFKARIYHKLGLGTQYYNHIKTVKTLMQKSKNLENEFYLKFVQNLIGDTLYFNAKNNNSSIQHRLNLCDTLITYYSNKKDFISYNYVIQMQILKDNLKLDFDHKDSILELLNLISEDRIKHHKHLYANVLSIIGEKYYYRHTKEDSSLNFFIAAFNVAAQIKDFEVMRRASFYLSLLYSFKKDKFNSNKFINEFNESHTRLIEREGNEINNVVIFTNQMRLELISLNNKKLQAIIKAERIEKNVFYLILIFIIILLFFLIIWLRNKNSLQQIKLKYKEVKLNNYIMRQRQSEMELKNQINAVESELRGYDNAKEYIANELHDEVANSLATIKMYLNILCHDFPQNAYILKTQNTIDMVTKKVRNLSHSLFMKDIDDNSISDYLRMYCDDFNLAGMKERIDLVVENEVYLSHLSNGIKRDIYLIFQECIINIIKHAKAQLIRVNLEMTLNGLITLQIIDDGEGMKNNRLFFHGTGITNIKKRVEKYTGFLSIEKNEPQGTIIKVQFSIS